jgi:hypothetical protein
MSVEAVVDTTPVEGVATEQQQLVVPAETPPQEPSVEAKEASGTEEKAKETPPKPEPPKERESRALALLAQRERNARAAEAQAKEARKALETERAEATAYREALKAVKDDPLTFLQKHANIDFETLTRRFLLNDPAAQPKKEPEDPAAALKKELEEIKAKLVAGEEESKKHAAELEEKRRQEGIDQHLRERLAYCKEHAEDFELVLANQTQARGMYMDLLQQAFLAKNGLPENPTPQQLQRTKELNSSEMVDVMKRVEELLTEEAERHLQGLRGTKRFAARFAQEKTTPTKTETAAPKTQPATQNPNPPKPVTTLTNDIPRVVPVNSNTTVVKLGRPETLEETVARIRQKFPSKTAG